MITRRLLGLVLGLGLATPAAAMTPGPRTRLFPRQTPQGEVRVAARTMGSGPLVVLVPSLGRGASDFDDLIVRLADAGFMAAAIDPRGVGQSAGPTSGLTLFDYAEDVAAAARGLSPDKAVFVGHAFGNRVVRALAAKHPEQVRGLVLFAAGGQVPIRPEVLTALNGVFEGLPPRDHLAAVKLAFFADGNDPAVWTGGWHAEVAKAQQAAIAATPPEQWTGGGGVPILVVQAAQDTVAPPANAEALKRGAPDRVEVVVLPNAGHAMLPERPRELAQILIGYLRRSP